MQIPDPRMLVVVIVVVVVGVCSFVLFGFIIKHSCFAFAVQILNNSTDEQTHNSNNSNNNNNNKQQHTGSFIICFRKLVVISCNLKCSVLCNLYSQ